MLLELLNEDVSRASARVVRAQAGKGGQGELSEGTLDSAAGAPLLQRALHRPGVSHHVRGVALARLETRSTQLKAPRA